ncbi:MAG: hypothetical protein JWP44_4191 [Mucilaginibacter sp.]|nr:hypothetical protein [Mucilaginibacter sp.]
MITTADLAAYNATNRRIAAWTQLMDATFGGANAATIDRLSDAYDAAKAAEDAALAINGAR